MKNNRFLAILPRSGLGSKYRLRLDNTIGIIDSDYYDSDNEGHIFIKMTNESTTDKAVSIERGWHLPRELFFRLETVSDDWITEKRNGGFGSTEE